MDTSALAKPVVGENDSLSLRRREQAEVGEDLGRLASGYVAGRGERVGSARCSSSVCRLVRQPHHRAVTLAAICSAIFNAESAGLALHVLMSIMTLFLSASARPQPQPGALAFC
jgi:transcriptional regulator GlxA family with amidase domain